MNYCFKAGKKVYGCGHYNCEGGFKKVQGMKYCHIAKKDIYSCDHDKCK